MNAITKFLLTAAAGVALASGTAGVAIAQSASVQTAIADGTVGEQADGYLGFNGNPSAELKAAVDQINIKRRAGYTDLAAKRGVTVQDMAAAIGCKTLASRVGPGQSYRLPDGSWSVRNGSAPVPLPAYCAAAN